MGSWVAAPTFLPWSPAPPLLAGYTMAPDFSRGELREEEGQGYCPWWRPVRAVCWGDLTRLLSPGLVVVGSRLFVPWLWRPLCRSNFNKNRYYIQRRDIYLFFHYLTILIVNYTSIKLWGRGGEEDGVAAVCTWASLPRWKTSQTEDTTGPQNLYSRELCVPADWTRNHDF